MRLGKGQGEGRVEKRDPGLGERLGEGRRKVEEKACCLLGDWWKRLFIVSNDNSFQGKWLHCVTSSSA